MPSDGLFDSLFVPGPLRAAIGDEAWLQAMLDAERALAAAGARAGIVPPEAAAAIAEACRAERFSPERIGEEGRLVANPAEPLVRALRGEVGEQHGRHVHRGATSQDIVDTAATLVSRAALDLILADVNALSAGCARLAREHRRTLLPARTLLQQALPTTLALKAAGWLVGVLEARRLLVHVRRERLAPQLGGAAGTLASLGEHGGAVAAAFAQELGLPEPVLPWHANRVRVAELAAALDIAAGAAAKIALDVVLLAQTEVGEASERAGEGRGASSTMPHKRNPAGATVALACARHAHASASLLVGGLAQEHERAVGAWQAEWVALTRTLGAAGGGIASTREVVEGLELRPGRMRSNIADVVLAERAASEVGADAVKEGLAAGRTLRETLSAAGVHGAKLDELLDPAGYLGSADRFVDRALDLYREELE